MFLGFFLTGFDKSLVFQLLPRVLKEMWNIECSIVELSIMKDKFNELSETLGLKAFAIGAGNEEGFAEHGTSVSDHTVGKSLCLLPRSNDLPC